MLYLQKNLTNFQKLFFRGKKRKLATVVENLKCTDVFFCYSNVTTFATSWKCTNFIFCLYPGRAEEMLYLHMYLTNFKKLFLCERRGRWLLRLNISSAQKFWFSHSNVTTFPTSWKCKNFNFSFYTVPAEMLYLQSYLTNFPITFFWLKEEEGGYCRWEFRVHRHFGFPIATLQLFQHPENVKISILGFTLSPQKCYISRSI